MSITPVTLYISQANSTAQTHAELLVTSLGAGGSTAGPTVVGAATSWGEIGMGGPVTYAAAGSMGAQSGHGALWDGGTSLLNGLQMSGAWSGTQNLSLSQSSKSVTATLVWRFSKYNTSSTAYTTIGTIQLSSQVINSTSPVGYTLSGSPFSPVLFGSNETIYIDLWSNILSNNMTSGGDINYYFSNSNTLGFSGSQYISPGFGPPTTFSRIIMSDSMVAGVSPGGVF